MLPTKYRVNWPRGVGGVGRGSTIGFHLLWHTVEFSHEYSSLFIIVIN